MSNYPPGVTGNEPQISGYPERTYVRSCDAKDVEVKILADDLHSWIASLAKLMEHDITHSTMKTYVVGIISVFKELEYTTFIEECQFKGEVDVILNRYSEYWQCPVCGTEHETEYDEIGVPEYD